MNPININDLILKGHRTAFPVLASVRAGCAGGAHGFGRALCRLRAAAVAVGILAGPSGLWACSSPVDISGLLMKQGSAAKDTLTSLFFEATTLAAAPDARAPDQGDELFASENANESELFMKYSPPC
jgi:hypothetical protein